MRRCTCCGAHLSSYTREPTCHPCRAPEEHGRHHYHYRTLMEEEPHTGAAPCHRDGCDPDRLVMEACACQATA